MINVFTLSWQGASKLEKLMPGLYENMKGFDFVWHIRNNGNDSETKKMVKTWGKDNIMLYEVGHNRDNFAQGMNDLFSKCRFDKSDVLLLINNDIVFGNDSSLLNMFNLMEQTDAGVVGARLIYPGTNKLQHAGVIFGEKYGKMPYHFRHGEIIDEHSKQNRFFQCVTAGLCILKTSSFKKVNGFNPNYFWAFDDIDLNLRIGRSGEKIAYCGQTEIYHEESASLKKNPVNKLFLQHNVKLFKEHHFGKYKLDHELYLKDPDYNVIP